MNFMARLPDAARLIYVESPFIVTTITTLTVASAPQPAEIIKTRFDALNLLVQQDGADFHQNQVCTSYLVNLRLRSTHGSQRPAV